MLYKLNANRLQTIFRGGMVGLIHNRSLTLQDGHYDESAAVTLMSTDTDNIAGSAGMIYEAWAMTLELLIGIALLARQLGWACIMPLVFVISKYHFTKNPCLDQYQLLESRSTQIK